MNKLELLAVTLFLPLACLKAEDKVWKARVTVEETDGTKTQTVCPFLAGNGAQLPILLSHSGQCTLVIDLRETSSKDGKSGGAYDQAVYTIYKTQQVATDSNVFAPMRIFKVTLPVALSKDIQLLKSWEGTITVRLSGSEDKE